MNKKEDQRKNVINPYQVQFERVPNQNRIYIISKYNKDIINIIKTTEKRIYHNEYKCWSIANQSYTGLLEMFRKMNLIMDELNKVFFF